jgi:citrate synthase
MEPTLMDDQKGGEALIALVSQTLGIPWSLVVDELGFGTIPEWDSLNHVQLMLALETAYGVEIDEERMISLTSIGRIRCFVTEGARESVR